MFQREEDVLLYNVLVSLDEASVLLVKAVLPVFDLGLLLLVDLAELQPICDELEQEILLAVPASQLLAQPSQQQG